MKVFVKSAGRKESQDYVWMCLDGRATPAEDAALSLAERSASKRGRVASFVSSMDGDTVTSALFFGNIDSGRTDFYGTPILNRLGIVFDFSDSQDVTAAIALATDWHSEASVLESLLREGIGAEEATPGFAVDRAFRDSVAKCASSAPLGRLRQDADLALFKSIRTAAGLVRQKENSTHPGVALRSPPSSSPQGQHPATGKIRTPSNPSMRIFVNTVTSGRLDYGWYVGGRPEYADRLWKICEPVRSVSADSAFFAALARETGKWVLFLQDVVGRDNYSNRPARFTFAIEIPDSDPDAQDKARRLLASWLHPTFLLPKMLAQFIDISGSEVVADAKKLLAAAEDVATLGATVLDHAPIGASRTWKHISRDRSNRDDLRDEAWRFVEAREFPSSPGVHFLFTHAPYSCKPASPDALPDIPARFVVTGFRDGEPDMGTSLDAKPDLPGIGPGGQTPAGTVPESASQPVSGEKVRSLGTFGIVAAMLVAFIGMAMRGCGCNGRRKPPEGWPSPPAVTNAPSAAVTNAPSVAVTNAPSAAVTNAPSVAVTNIAPAAVTNAPSVAVTNIAPAAVNSDNEPFRP